MMRRDDIVPLTAGVAAAALADAAPPLAPTLTPLLTDARLPDPGQFSTVAGAAVLGGMVGGAIARARREPEEQVARATAKGAFVGGWIAIFVWLASFFTP